MCDPAAMRATVIAHTGDENAAAQNDAQSSQKSALDVRSNMIASEKDLGAASQGAALFLILRAADQTLKTAALKLQRLQDSGEHSLR